jgi:hypothetical protein
MRLHHVLNILKPVIMDAAHLRRAELAGNPQILQAAGRDPE